MSESKIFITKSIVIKECAHSFIREVKKLSLRNLPCQCYSSIFLNNLLVDGITSKICGTPIPEQIMASSRKRCAEFIVGRYLAELGLKDLGVIEPSVLIGANREPLWPVGMVGSISHTDDEAIAIVARGHSIKYLGIDIEKCFCINLTLEIGEMVLTPTELAFRDSCRLSPEFFTTLVFSAKESLFKALFYEVGCYFDFKVAEIVYIDILENKFILKLIENIGPSLKAGLYFEGVYEVDNNSILTIVYEHCIDRYL